MPWCAPHRTITGHALSPRVPRPSKNLVYWSVSLNLTKQAHFLHFQRRSEHRRSLATIAGSPCAHCPSAHSSKQHSFSSISGFSCPSSASLQAAANVPSPCHSSLYQSRRRYLLRPRGKSTSAAFAELEEEFSSGQGVARGLLLRYRKVVGEGYQDNLKEFARAGITAYALGWTEEGLRREMNARLVQPGNQAQGDGLESAGPGDTKAENNAFIVLEEVEEGKGEPSPRGWPDTAPLSGDEPVQWQDTLTPVTEQELEECLLWLVVVFVTLTCLPQYVVRRWSTTVPVSSDSLHEWRGFCSIIAKAYYDQGMAWYSIQRLQMEQMVVTGRAEPSALVADRMRLVFMTLEAVDPRWGGLKDFPTL